MTRRVYAKKPGWDGRRKGAGRKKTRRVRHARRMHAKAHPVAVTIRVVEGVASLRKDGLGELIGRHFRRVMGRRVDFRVTAFAILSNHIHLIVEADHQPALSRGMQGLLSGMARVINRKLGRKGRLWADRYHAHELTTPTETRNTLRYVLMNRAKHGGPLGIDPLSSATWFDGFVDAVAAPHGSPVAPPRTWLLRTGWRDKGGGPLSIHERPGRD